MGSQSPERGELAIWALHRARRAAADKPKSFNEAVSNKMTEVLAKRDAEAHLTVPENLVKSCGEAIRPEFRLPHILDTLENPNMIAVIASEHRLDLAACVDFE